MRLRLRRHAHDSCEHWLDVPLSSTEAGPDDATVDHYAAHASLRPGESSLAAFERIRGRLLRYDVFPPLMFRGVVCPDGAIVPGATIVQQVLRGPFVLEMAVRVEAVWDREAGGVREAGFSYSTLAGHAEQGVASFQVAHDASG